MNTLTDKLAAALRAIPADEYDMRVYEGDGFHYFCCKNSPHLNIEHAPDCWYVRVREALAEYNALRARPTAPPHDAATVRRAPLWYAADYGDVYAVGVGDKQIATGMTRDYARRFVACVNACAGIPTERLEAATISATDLIRSLLTAVVDLHNGYPIRELHIDVDTLRQQAAALGVTLEDEDDH